MQPRMYNSMITLYGNVLLPDLAEEKFNELKIAGFIPTDSDYAALISAFVKSYQMDRAIQVLELVKQAEISPTHVLALILAKLQTSNFSKHLDYVYFYHSRARTNTGT